MTFLAVSTVVHWVKDIIARMCPVRLYPERTLSRIDFQIKDIKAKLQGKKRELKDYSKACVSETTYNTAAVACLRELSVGAQTL